MALNRFRNTPIKTAATTVVKTGAGHLKSITILGGTMGAITVYNNTAASGTEICPEFTPPANTIQTLTFDTDFSLGCTIVTAAATVLSVSYQ